MATEYNTTLTREIIIENNRLESIYNIPVADTGLTFQLNFTLLDIFYLEEQELNIFTYENRAYELLTDVYTYTDNKEFGLKIDSTTQLIYMEIP